MFSQNNPQASDRKKDLKGKIQHTNGEKIRMATWTSEKKLSQKALRGKKNHFIEKSAKLTYKES